MCCFSRPVKLVADTNIFARAADQGRQFLVYSLRVAAAEELAMILPIPVPPNPAEDAVRFINLEKYPEFFTHLSHGFPIPRASRQVDSADTAPAPKPALKVVEVGSFVASFVPSINDFSRLDERFRLPTEVWGKLPRYRDWGFAVFQLNKGENEQKIHPMAFEFPRRNPRSLFFPTVHIHDGSVPARARFDHHLYCQLSAGEMAMDWEESRNLAQDFVPKIAETQGIIAPQEHVYRKKMRGVFANTDVVI